MKLPTVYITALVICILIAFACSDSNIGMFEEDDDDDVSELQFVGSCYEYGESVICDGQTIVNQNDLDSLQHCKCIDWSIEIESKWLETIELPNLEYLAGDLKVTNSSVLERLSIPKLKTVEGVTSGVYLLDNDKLAVVELPMLTNIEGGGLTVYGNAVLESLDGFSSLHTVSENITIRDNNSLASVEGLSQVTSAGVYWLSSEESILIKGNPSLATCDAVAFAVGVEETESGTCVVDNQLDSCDDDLSGCE